MRRSGHGNDDLTIDLQGIALTVPNRGATVAHGITDGIYGDVELEVFGVLASMCKVIVDVGANVGAYCCVAANNAPTSATIVAFESDAENLVYLHKNIKSIEQFGWKPRIRAEETTLDADLTLDEYASAHLTNPVELLRVAAEGHEGDVLRGATKMLSQERPTLFLAFAPARLDNRKFSPQEFLDLVFETYEHIFIVDEPGATIRRCTKDELIDNDGYKTVHLIAAAQHLHLMTIGVRCNK
jgi:hypothetical protein